MSKALLLSNSTNPGEDYLEWCRHTIADFIGEDNHAVVFIPFAGVTLSSIEYTKKVNMSLAKLGIEVLNLDVVEDKVAAVKNASVIVVGGGNTFHLLSSLYEFNLISSIRDAVNSGVKYVGWSAGSNVTCPNICTTNDMPILQPPSFEAMALISFQINPHYTEKMIEGHAGESRKARLTEFIAANPKSTVVCLPESTYLVVDDDKIVYKGKEDGLIIDQSGSHLLQINQQL